MHPFRWRCPARPTEYQLRIPQEARFGHDPNRHPIPEFLPFTRRAGSCRNRDQRLQPGLIRSHPRKELRQHLATQLAKAFTICRRAFSTARGSRPPRTGPRLGCGHGWVYFTSSSSFARSSTAFSGVSLSIICRAVSTGLSCPVSSRGILAISVSAMVPWVGA
jgi:hypothetical protein